MKQNALLIAKESMKDNRKLLTALGKEKPVKLIHTLEDREISTLLNLIPKSTAGKIALLGITTFILWELLRTRD